MCYKMQKLQNRFKISISLNFKSSVKFLFLRLSHVPINRNINRNISHKMRDAQKVCRDLFSFRPWRQKYEKCLHGCKCFWCIFLNETVRLRHFTFLWEKKQKHYLWSTGEPAGEAARECIRINLHTKVIKLPNRLILW